MYVVFAYYIEFSFTRVHVDTFRACGLRQGDAIIIIIIIFSRCRPCDLLTALYLVASSDVNPFSFSSCTPSHSSSSTLSVTFPSVPLICCHSILYLFTWHALSNLPLKLLTLGAWTTCSGRLFHRLTILDVKKFDLIWVQVCFFCSLSPFPLVINPSEVYL